MSPRKIVLTGDTKRKGPSAMKIWAEDPGLDGYRLWSILTPFWKNNIEVEILSPAEYLGKDPTKYLFALVASKNFGAFPHWKGKLVAYIHDFHSVIDYTLRGYSAALAVQPRGTKTFSLENGYDLGDFPILWHPNVAYPEVIGEVGQRPQSTRKNFLVTGALHPYYYPDRYQLHQSIRRSLKKLRYGVHCSHIIGSSLIRNRRLAKKYQGQMWFKLLASYKTAIFAQDRWGYLVAKYTEIPLCGCLMVAPPIEEAREAGLVAGENYLAIDVDRFWNTIEWIRNNQDRAEEIRKNGINWAQKFVRYASRDLFQQNMDIILSI